MASVNDAAIDHFALFLHVATSLDDSDECQLMLSMSFSPWTTKGLAECRCQKQCANVQEVYLTITYWQNKSSTRLSIHYACDSSEQFDKGQH